MSVFSSYLTDVFYIPNVKTEIIVDYGDPSILLVIRDSAGITVNGIAGVGGHVGQLFSVLRPLGNIHLMLKVRK